MEKLLTVIRYNKPAFEKAMDYSNGIDENIGDMSHEDLADKYENLVNQLFGIVEPIYKVAEEAHLFEGHLAADSSTNK